MSILIGRLHTEIATQKIIARGQCYFPQTLIDQYSWSNDQSISKAIGNYETDTNADRQPRIESY